MPASNPVDENFDTSFLDEFEREEAAQQATRPPTSSSYRGTGEPLDLRGFLQRHGIEVHKELPFGDGTKFQLKHCPFNHDHRAPDSFVAQYASGATMFKCSHQSCNSFKWHDFLRHFEPTPARQEWRHDGGDKYRRADADHRREDHSSITEDADKLQSLDVGEVLSVSRPAMRPPIVHGLLRRGETANIIAAPKVGKSWLVYDLCLSLATGGKFLNRFQCERGRVLLLDNELHIETLLNRIATAADGLGVKLSELQGGFRIKSIRGDWRDLTQIECWLRDIDAGEHDLIVLDAFYRALPKGVSENENGAITGIYNLIDQITRRHNCGWVNIHHSSKGGQGDKAVTDIGAGAGAQSRAADTHIVLRPHQDDGVIVLDAALRSFAPIEPLALRWQFPCFVPDEADPNALAGRQTQQERRQHERDTTAVNDILVALGSEPATARVLRAKTGLSRERLQRLLDKLEADGAVTGEAVIVRGNESREYKLPGDVGDNDRPGNHPVAHVVGRGVCGSLKEEPPTRPRSTENARNVEDQNNRPRGTAADPIVFGAEA